MKFYYEIITQGEIRVNNKEYEKAEKEYEKAENENPL